MHLEFSLALWEYTKSTFLQNSWWLRTKLTLCLWFSVHIIILNTQTCAILLLKPHKKITTHLKLWVMMQGHVARTCYSNKIMCCLYKGTSSKGRVAVTKSYCIHTHENVAGTCHWDKRCNVSSYVSWYFKLVQHNCFRNFVRATCCTEFNSLNCMGNVAGTECCRDATSPTCEQHVIQGLSQSANLRHSPPCRTICPLNFDGRDINVPQDQTILLCLKYLKLATGGVGYF